MNFCIILSSSHSFSVTILSYAPRHRLFLFRYISFFLFFFRGTVCRSAGRPVGPFFDGHSEGGGVGSLTEENPFVSSGG